jgi:hypothetical protein
VNGVFPHSRIVRFQAEPQSTEGNRIKPYRSKKMANKRQRSRDPITSNTFAKRKRKVESFSEGQDETEKR